MKKFDLPAISNLIARLAWAKTASIGLRVVGCVVFDFVHRAARLRHRCPTQGYGLFTKLKHRGGDRAMNHRLVALR